MGGVRGRLQGGKGEGGQLEMRGCEAEREDQGTKGSGIGEGGENLSK